MRGRSFLAAAVLAVPAFAAGAKAPAAHDPHALFLQLEKTDAVAEGPRASKRVLYVFFDANCWYCHLTWKALQPYERAGLRVRWVPVAYQKETSKGRAAAIMEAKNRAQALRENETYYRADSYDGGIEVAQVSRRLAAQLERNTKLMREFGAPGTPLLVWKDEKGVVRTKVGMPRLAELPAIADLPEQENDDPELADFR